MPDWFVNSVAAKILHDDHGLNCTTLNKSDIHFYGNYWYDFNSCRLMRHPYSTRQPKYQLTVDDVLAMIIMPEEARDAYFRAVGTIVTNKAV